MREIARLPQARFDWWIQKTFNVLPTDSRFLDLTSEQKELIYEHLLIDNPDLAKNSESYYDPEFEDLWEEHAPIEDSTEGLFEETENGGQLPNIPGKENLFEDSTEETSEDRWEEV